MKRGEFVLKLSERIIRWIKPFCRRVEIVGSIRRKEKNPVDIDIVLIPKNRGKFENFLKKRNYKFVQGGEKKSRWKIEGVQVELYYTDEKEWGAALLAYSSRRGSGIGLRIVARFKGFKLNQHGLFNRKTGKRIAGKTEEKIYHALGRKWKRPEDR